MRKARASTRGRRARRSGRNEKRRGWRPPPTVVARAHPYFRRASWAKTNEYLVKFLNKFPLNYFRVYIFKVILGHLRCRRPCTPQSAIPRISVDPDSHRDHLRRNPRGVRILIPMQNKSSARSRSSTRMVPARSRTTASLVLRGCGLVHVHRRQDLRLARHLYRDLTAMIPFNFAVYILYGCPRHEQGVAQLLVRSFRRRCPRHVQGVGACRVLCLGLMRALIPRRLRSCRGLAGHRSLTMT